MDEYLACVDEPIADAAMLPTYVLAKRAAREVKVVLTGEGADEVFAGYDYYRKFFGGTDSGLGAQSTTAQSDLRHVREQLEAAVGGPFPAPERDVTSPYSGFPYCVQPEFVWCMLNRDRRPSL